MKEYGDERFIALLREGRAEAKKDIRKGKVLADGQVLEFREREIIKKMLWMWLPDGFGPLSGEMARLKYPNENRPDIIYTNPGTTINVTFSHKTDRLEEGQEEEIRDYMGEIVQRLHPSSEIIEKNTAEAENCRLAWFDFVTPAIDTDIYNIMFFTSLQGRLLMGGCNCLDEDKDVWKELFVQMLGTVRSAW